MDDLFQKARENWGDYEKLSQLMVDIAERYKIVAEDYGTATANFASSFINEKETAFKTSIAETEYRVKSSMGGITETLRENLVSLSFLFQSVASRVDYLSHRPLYKPFTGITETH